MEGEGHRTSVPGPLLALLFDLPFFGSEDHAMDESYAGTGYVERRCRRLIVEDPLDDLNARDDATCCAT